MPGRREGYKADARPGRFSKATWACVSRNQAAAWIVEVLNEKIVPPRDQDSLPGLCSGACIKPSEAYRHPHQRPARRADPLLIHSTDRRFI